MPLHLEILPYYFDVCKETQKQCTYTLHGLIYRGGGDGYIWGGLY